MIYEKVITGGDEPEIQRVMSLLPGKSEAEKAMNFSNFVQNKNQGFVDSRAQFISFLQKGLFTPIYLREKELKRKLAKFHYEERIVKVMENHLQRRSKRSDHYTYHKAGFNNGWEWLMEALNHNFLDEDNFSTKTLTDEETALEDNEYTQYSLSHNQSQSQRVINTTRRVDSTSKTIKTQKNVLTLKKSSPEWLANYRAQEAERYRHPLKPWEYTLSDNTR